MAENITLKLTNNQKLLWAGQLLHPDSPMYNMAFSHHLHIDVDVATFTNAFRILVESNIVMKSTIQIVNDRPNVIFLDSIISLEHLDWSAYDEIKITNKLARRARNKFDLSKLMFDASLIKVKDDHYIFYLNQHHIITDGWAVSIQFKKLVDIYDRLKKGEEVLVTKSIIENNTTLLQSIDKDSEAYWSDLLNENPIPAPHYDSINTRQSSACFHSELHIDENKYEKIVELVHRPDLRSWTDDQSVFIVLMSLMAIVESRLKRQSTVKIGTPAHGRYTKEDRDTLGLYIKIFPVEIELSEDETFISLYQKTKLQVNAFMKYSQKAESTSETVQTFNSLLNFINVDTQVEGYKIFSEWISTGHMDPNHDLKIQVHNFNKESGLIVGFDLNESVFRQDHVETITRMYSELIDSICKDPYSSIYKLSLSENLLLESYNDTAYPHPTDTNIVALIDESINKNGDEIAITSASESYTFRELDQLSNKVANYILESNIASDTVCVGLERSTDMPIVLLGILKAGKAYVPIDPDFPIERQKYIFDHTQSDLLITNLDFNIKDINSISYQEIKESSASENVVDVEILPSSLMYIIYTSGSTGVPKGVRNLHSGLVNRLLWAQRRYQLEPSVDKVLQKTNYCFDVSVWELFWPLMSGVELVLADPNGHKDSHYLIETIERYGITTMHFVPPMLEVFLQSLTNNDRCKSLRKILASGEALKTNNALECKRLLPHVELHNLYGPTEAAIDVTAQQILPSNDPIVHISLGKPVDNTKIYILDPQRRKCGTGTIGEIYLSGIQVSDGYHRDEKKTNSVFVNNPFDSSSNASLYNTGDLGYWNGDGTVSYLGRSDFQVKLRGYRIELEEISSTIVNRNNNIKQAISIVTNDSINPQIVSFFVADNELDGAEIRNAIREYLPDYMIPTHVKQLDKIPVTSNGKIDRKALSIIKIEAPESTNDSQPKNEIEEIIQSIWEEVLGSNFGVNQSFFAVGGDSLSGIKVMLRINREFQLSLAVVEIWKYSTIATLAVYVEDTIVELLSKMEA